MRFLDFVSKSRSIGLEICPQGVFFALMGRGAGSFFLERAASRPFSSGVLKPSLRDANILDPRAFCDRLKEAHALLCHKETRLSVTLPDAAGRILLMDIEGRFKSRSEAIDIIRWKLKKNISFNSSDAHLDYQQLMIRENNEMSLLVTIVSRSVITQYEDLMISAGFSPKHIDLNVFSLFRPFENYPAVQRDVTLLSYYGGALAIIMMRGVVPEFLRIKDIAEAPANGHRVYREICNSFMAYRERFPDRPPNKLFCITEPGVMRGFCEMVSEATGSETFPMEVKTVVKTFGDAPTDQQSLFPFTAAIGAALRNL